MSELTTQDEAESKADLTLENGTPIKFNLSLMTISEYRALFDKKQDQTEEDVIMARVAGLALEDYRQLSYPDWRRLTKRFFEVAMRPIDDPNSRSASTST